MSWSSRTIGAIQSAIVRALRTEGYAVTSAGDLARAREQASAGVDFVVLDLRLPDGFGLELCHELRRAEMNVSVLVVSALTRVATRVEALDAGADDFLPKPFELPELRARVRALGRRSHWPRKLVGRLRRKLGPQVIKTVWGEGYALGEAPKPALAAPNSEESK